MAEFTSNNIMQCLDSPVKFLFWTMDEMVVLAMPAMVGMLLDWVITGMCFSVVGLYLLRKFKNQVGSKGSIKQGLYWWLPTQNHLPKSSIREYLG